jgi:hypothetical protein
MPIPKRTDQDRRRHADWARRIAADQRLEAQRAAAAIRSISRQARSIRTGGGRRPNVVPALKGAGVVTVILPNGRRSRMRIVPALAPIQEVNRLRSVIIVNERRQAIAIEKHARAIAALAAAETAAVKKLLAMQTRSDRDLRDRLVEAADRLDWRIDEDRSRRSTTADKKGSRVR